MMKPTDKPDLATRLRQFDGQPWDTTYCYNGLREAAATEIERLRGIIRRIRNEVEWAAVDPPPSQGFPNKTSDKGTKP